MNDVSAFSGYVNELRSSLLDADLQRTIEEEPNRLNALLNGEASTMLAALVPASIRRADGIFFTEAELGERVARVLCSHLTRGLQVADPTCGVGNLLLACSRYLPAGKQLAETVDLWSSRLAGSDLHEEFVTATRLRLLLLAAIRSKDSSDVEHFMDRPDAFPGLRTGDALSDPTLFGPHDCIVFNPPFGYMAAPSGCKWSTGRVQKAAVFLETALECARKGQVIVSILPDVLRSGSRYAKWRETIARSSVSVSIHNAGRFNNEADVDVFICHIVSGETQGKKWPGMAGSKKRGRKRVSDIFDVHVGTVVPYRDPQQGHTFPYIHARTAPAWATVDEGTITEYRQFKGKTFRPPFLVVHRTSRPGDKHRCRAAMVVCRQSAVAVENHLIVMQPKDGNMSQCKKALHILEDNRTDRWMNGRIRCRHLTVGAVKDLPWWDAE